MPRALRLLPLLPAELLNFDPTEDLVIEFKQTSLNR